MILVFCGVLKELFKKSLDNAQKTEIFAEISNELSKQLFITGVVIIYGRGSSGKGHTYPTNCIFLESPESLELFFEYERFSEFHRSPPAINNDHSLNVICPSESFIIHRPKYTSIILFCPTYVCSLVCLHMNVNDQ